MITAIDGDHGNSIPSRIGTVLAACLDGVGTARLDRPLSQRAIVSPIGIGNKNNGAAWQRPILKKNFTRHAGERRRSMVAAREKNAEAKERDQEPGNICAILGFFVQIHFSANRRSLTGKSRDHNKLAEFDQDQPFSLPSMCYPPSES